MISIQISRRCSTGIGVSFLSIFRQLANLKGQRKTPDADSPMKPSPHKIGHVGPLQGKRIFSSVSPGRRSQSELAMGWAGIRQPFRLKKRIRWPKQTFQAYGDSVLIWTVLMFANSSCISLCRPGEERQNADGWSASDRCQSLAGVPRAIQCAQPFDWSRHFCGCRIPRDEKRSG